LFGAKARTKTPTTPHACFDAIYLQHVTSFL
jgi:hypothetical protein